MLGLYALVAVVLGGFSSWRDYNASLAEAEVTATNYANLLEEHAKRSLEAADLILQRLIDRSAEKGMDKLAASATDWNILHDAVEASPQTGALYLLDVQGKLLFSTRQFPADPAVNFSDRNFFATLQKGGTSQSVISRSFFEPGTGKVSFAIARRIEDKAGIFQGVAMATIEVDYFKEFYRALGYAEHVAFGIYKHDGSILVRYPMVDADVGRAIPANAPILQLSPVQPVGTYRAISTYDYFHRVVAYRKVEKPELLLWVTVTEEDALAGWKLRLIRNMVLVVISLVALGALSRMALRGIQREEQVAAKLAALFELSPMGMVRTDLDGRFVEANPAFLQMMGLKHDEVGRMGRLDVTPPDYAEADSRHMETLLKEGRFGPYEKEYIHKDGHTIPVSLNGTLVTNAACGTYVWSIVEDISHRRATEAQTQLAASVFHNTFEAIMITDADSNILSVNPAFTAITGYEADEVIGQKPSMLKSHRHSASFYGQMWSDLTTKGSWQGQIWNRRKDGHFYLAWQSISAITDRQGRIVRFVSLSSDMTELHLKDEQIRHQAYHDALTGLPNRLLLQDRLGQAIEVARREDLQVAVMFIDLDRFKVVNDSLGHDAGDALLVEVAKRLTERLRRSDTVARLGGDEFVVILSLLDNVSEATEVADSIIERFSDSMIVAGHEMRVTSSIGIAVFPRDGDDVGTLMRNADTAMYGAKGAGRNTFRFFDAAMNAAAVERLNLEEAMVRALDNGEFQLHYQPKVDLASGTVIGAEALLRWQSPDRGQVPPVLFIPLAEESGLIIDIGTWVLEESFRQTAEWARRLDQGLKIAVNVSPRQFLAADFADRVAHLLAEHDLDPALIELEVTESAVMSDPERAIAHLLSLRQIGVGVAVDDFGTGYSSLSYLKRLPLTTVKIDRSFVHGVDLEPDNAAIVGAILGLAEALGLGVVAEGVETDGEERYLIAAGCPVAQGFRYAKALPAADFENWVATFAMA
jgi:diguanylate cyclase (GGDEF)-like protein/PAS domain S-box-containing protein